MNTRRIYEVLEANALRLDDDADDELAERIRSVMDFVWYRRLTKVERADLNARSGVVLGAESGVFIKLAVLPAVQQRQAVVEPLIPYQESDAA